MLSFPKNLVAIAAVRDSDKIGRIFVPEAAKERSDQGIVAYIGPQVKDLKVGDYVLFPGWTGTTLHISEESLLIILPEDQVLCKIHPAHTTISGLYHVDSAGVPFTATYESAIALLQKQYWELPRMINIKQRKF